MKNQFGREEEVQRSICSVIAGLFSAVTRQGGCLETSLQQAYSLIISRWPRLRLRFLPLVLELLRLTP